MCDSWCSQEFERIDTNPTDGKLTLKELKQALRNIPGVTAEEIKDIFDTVTEHVGHEDHTINYLEFVAAAA